jgi:hypothetical protein
MFTQLVTPAPAASADATARFAQLLQAALADGSLHKLLLSQYMGTEEPQLERLLARPIVLRGKPCLSLVWRYPTKDITKNLGHAEAITTLMALLGTSFQNAHLHTATHEVQWALGRKGKASLRVGKLHAKGLAPNQALPPLPDDEHNLAKRRQLSLDAAFWLDLGLTHWVDGAPKLVPAMARKWKQVNKFIEVMSAALQRSPLGQANTVRVADFGSGKGYLSFAMHHWLVQQGKQALVTGVELRDDMVAICNAAVARHALTGLQFEQGDVRSRPPSQVDVMIALHACDIATDHAMHEGVRAGASIIMCSPCCHKQLRPQMQTPPPLRPLLQHGIHLGQEAEMVTDSIRALLLEAEGYDTQVFEFVALEHTSKNKMILAVKKSGAALASAVLRKPERLHQLEQIKQFYGVREQCLQTLLSA